MSNAVFQQFFDDAPDILFRLDLAPRAHPTRFQLVYVNPAVEKILGYSPAECSADPLPLVQLITSSGVDSTGSLTQALPAGQHTVMNRVTARDGTARWIETRLTVTDTPQGGRRSVEGIARDVTDHKQLQEKAHHNEHLLRLFVNNTPAAIAMFDRDMRYLAYSKYFLHDYHLQDQDITGRSHYDVFPEIPERWKEIHRRCLAGAVERCDEDPFPRADGSLDWVRWEIHPWHEADGTIGGILLMSEVITERKQIENQLRASLVEKEILLREVHHRVKNNLSAIIGLLDMRRMTSDTPEERVLLIELINRIRSMAIIHEQLYQSDTLEKINVQRYLQSFIAHLRATFQLGDQIVVLIEAGGVELNLDQAVPCGLIVNELVTNAIQHAFPSGAGRDLACEVQITMTAAGEQYQLEVCDNGVGLPPDLDWRTSRSIGLRLVRMLGEHQLRGTIDVDATQGTRFQLRFAAKNRK